MVSVGYYKRYVRKGFNAKNPAIRNIFYVLTKKNQVKSEAYHPEAFNFPYTFETMLPIIPDQWKSLLQFSPK